MKYKCNNCSGIFISSSSLWGHQNKCKGRVFEQFEEDIQNFDFEEPSIEDSIGEQAFFDEEQCSTISDNGSNGKGYTVNEDLLKYQKNFFRKVDISSAHPVKLTTGEYKSGNKVVYIKLLEYIVNSHGVSDSSASELMACIQSMSKGNGKEIPLPKRFSRLAGILLDPISDLAASVTLRSIPFPEAIFGNIAQQLKPAKTIVLNILEVIASMLVNRDIVGDSGENFHFEYRPQFNENGTRVFSDPSSGEWFRRTEIAVKNELGDEVFVLGKKQILKTYYNVTYIVL